jgi:hypothetical protein
MEKREPGGGPRPLAGSKNPHAFDFLFFRESTRGNRCKMQTRERKEATLLARLPFPPHTHRQERKLAWNKWKLMSRVAPLDFLGESIFAPHPSALTCDLIAWGRKRNVAWWLGQFLEPTLGTRPRYPPPFAQETIGNKNESMFHGLLMCTHRVDDFWPLLPCIAINLWHDIDVLHSRPHKNNGLKFNLFFQNHAALYFILTWGLLIAQKTINSNHRYPPHKNPFTLVWWDISTKQNAFLLSPINSLRESSWDHAPDAICPNLREFFLGKFFFSLRRVTWDSTLFIRSLLRES